MKYLRKNDLVTGALRYPFIHPPRNASMMFKNLKAVTPVLMKPGGFTSVNRVFSFNGRMTDLCVGLFGSLWAQAIPNGTTTSPYATTGSCTMLGLEQTMRTGMTTTSDPVKLLLNQKFYYSYRDVKTKKRGLPCFNVDEVPTLTP